jgi:DNA-binding SARP family transcriptional activator/tetratricopeptide (TPR) repeat protein
VTVAPHFTGSSLLVTAAAGYGKSALLDAHRPDGGVVISAPALVADGLPDRVSWIGVDDFDGVGVDDQAHLVGLLAERQDVGVALASRSTIDAAVRGGLRGQVRERDATDLALTPYAIARLLADEYGVTDPETALRVAGFTAGWPTLVHLAADALRRDAHVDLATAMTAPGAPAADWIRSHVLAALPPGVEAVLRAAAGIDPTGPVTQAVCDTLLAGSCGGGTSGLVERLRRAGLLVPRRRMGQITEVVMVPAVALLLRNAGGPPAGEVVAAIARTHESERAWLSAARAHAAAGDRVAVVRLIGERGEDMLRRGDSGPVAQLVEQVVGEALDDEPGSLRRTYADALRMSGDPTRARRAFAPLVARADEAGWQPGLAARCASLHYLCGEFESALDVLDRCTDVPVPEADQGEDVVDWLACRVHVLAMLGRPEDARSDATRCLEVAERLGDARPLGVAHLAVARTCRGTLKDLHHGHALRYVTEADDALTATRALAAQTCRLLAAARYDHASVTAREAARMARLCCPPGLQAAALHNLGEALARTGELDEALWHLECSVALCRRLGPARAALGLVGTADVHRSLGHVEQSSAAYAEAVALARGSGDVQVLVSALCGRALLAADEQAPEAEDAAAEALRLAPHDQLAIALTASGRVAVGRGDRAAAVEHARRAVAAARDARAVDQLADALELEAAVVDDPGRAREALTEALSIWSAGGAGPAFARVEVLIGRLPDADGNERSRARDAVRTLGALGIHGLGGSAVERGSGGGSVSVGVLGPFRVTVEGTEVPLPAWRSRQARTLVKILAAHRGRVVTRARLCDLLWPDDDPARTGHRLSVLLATVRGVLDPAKAWPPDRYIAADQCGVRLDLSAVVLDADLLLRDASHAAALIESDDVERAREVLAHVDELFRGDAFEDESEEWADGLREEVRAAWVRSVRRLATLQSREGRGAEALGILARLLTIDPYDERVHRRLVMSLVRAGRHGEARRAFDRWCQAMEEIDAPPPDPRVVCPAPDSA